MKGRIKASEGDGACVRSGVDHVGGTKVSRNELAEIGGGRSVRESWKAIFWQPHIIGVSGPSSG